MPCYRAQKRRNETIYEPKQRTTLSTWHLLENFLAHHGKFQACGNGDGNGVGDSIGDGDGDGIAKSKKPAIKRPTSDSLHATYKH